MDSYIYEGRHLVIGRVGKGKKRDVCQWEGGEKQCSELLRM